MDGANKFTSEQIDAVNPKDPKVKWRLWNELTDKEKVIQRLYKFRRGIISDQGGLFRAKIQGVSFLDSQYEPREFKPSDFETENSKTEEE